MSPTRIPRSLKLVVDEFGHLKDPRVDRTKIHPLTKILVMALCGAICGVDGWDELVDFCRSRKRWFAEFLDMAGGVPSADTFRRVFERLSTKGFQECFVRWVASLSTDLTDEVVAIDGKTLKGIVEQAGKHNQLHLVHVWATRQKLLLAQQAVANGAAGEIEAVPRLLELLDLGGAVITTDANSCTAPITRAIVDAGADFVLAVKGNRGRFYDHVIAAFADVSLTAAAYREVDQGHGREEVREVSVVEPREWPWHTKNSGEWAGLRTAVRVARRRQVGNDQPTEEVHYFVSSMPPNAKKHADTIRAHWGIENGLHWVLDVAFNDDNRSIRNRAAAENWATVARIALMLLKREPRQRGIAAKRKIAGWDPEYLVKVLTSGKSIT